MFVCFDSLRPINNLSVIKVRVILGRTSSVLAQGQVRLEPEAPQSRVKHSTTEPLHSHEDPEQTPQCAVSYLGLHCYMHMKSQRGIEFYAYCYIVICSSHNLV